MWSVKTGYWFVDWSFACLIASVVTATSIILSSNKIQNGDILVPANPGSPGKWPLKREERDCNLTSIDNVCYVFVSDTSDLCISSLQRQNFS